MHLLINLQLSYKYFLEVVYKDISNENIYLEIYAYGRKYIRFGKIDSIDDNKWKTTKIEIPTDLLIFSEGTDYNYQSLHIQQLLTLYKMTGEDIFREYAVFFENYYKAVK